MCKSRFDQAYQEDSKDIIKDQIKSFDDSNQKKKKSNGNIINKFKEVLNNQ